MNTAEKIIEEEHKSGKLNRHVIYNDIQIRYICCLYCEEMVRRAGLEYQQIIFE